MEILCKVKRIKNATDGDFLKALKIYQKQVNSCIKTEENQIIQYISKKSQTTSREMIFYSLVCNDIVIGYAEIGILFKTKTFFIDYFVLDSLYQNNAYFYICYNLVIQDLLSIKKYADFKYIIVENYVGLNENINEVFCKKCLSLENYKIIDIGYKQPGLFIDGDDSVVDCQLLIKETSQVGNLKDISKSLMLNILKDIFYNHYCEWFSHFFNEEEYKTYVKAVEKIYKNIESKTKDKIETRNYTYINCKYFKLNKCDFNQNTEFSVPKKFKFVIFIFVLLSAIVLSVGIAIGLTFFLRYLNVPEGIISTVTSITSVLLASVGTILSVKSSKK